MSEGRTIVVSVLARMDGASFDPESIPDETVGMLTRNGGGLTVSFNRRFLPRELLDGVAERASGGEPFVFDRYVFVAGPRNDAAARYEVTELGRDGDGVSVGASYGCAEWVSKAAADGLALAARALEDCFEQSGR
jgi:hypothetical protein